MSKEINFNVNEIRELGVTLKNGEVLKLISLNNIVSIQDLLTMDWSVDSRIPNSVVDQILESRNSSNFIPTDNDVRKHLMGDKITFYVRQQPEKVVGFDAISFASPKSCWGSLLPDHPFSNEPGVYFAGALIDGSMQKSGLYTLASMERVKRGIEKGYKYVFTESQNPNIEAGIKDTLDKMIDFGEIKSYAMNERVLLKGLYGQCMYKTIPINDEVSFDELDYAAGDAFALIFKLEY